MKMNRVEHFLSQINQRENNRWDRWRDYRNVVTDQILKVLFNRPNAEVLIIGSGALDDLDLGRIKLQTNRLDFLDLDEKATVEGLKRQGMDIHDVHVIKTDLTRFDDVHFFESWQRMMNDEPSVTETILMIEEKMNLIYQEHFQQGLNKTYDVVILLPTYTQLIYQQWIHLIDQSHPKAWTNDAIIKMKSYVLDLMVPLIDHVNEGIHACIKKHGIMMAISDVIEFNDEDFKLIKHTYPSLSEHDLMNYYLSYLNQYGMGLGDYGLWSLKSLLNLETSGFLLWPFSDHRTMLVQYMILTNSMS